MEGISDIRIAGIDPRRPPELRKEPYIDLYFELSHKVPVDWAEDFNALLAAQDLPARIRAADGLFIETWVRTVGEVAEHLGVLKRCVAQCNEAYIAKIRLRQGKEDDDNASLASEAGAQGQLNRIIAGLDFED